jgi:O-acetyl-ADP-ribose deacetylase (regulator of RNase III)
MDHMGIRYIVGDATTPEGPGTKLIVHVCNDRGGWGAGFVLALSRRWAAPEAAYRRWAKSRKDFELGMVQIVAAEEDIYVANVIAQAGYRSATDPVPLRYDALAKGLAKLATQVDRTTTLHMPRIGSGKAGGDWSAVERIIESELCTAGFDVTVYDIA